MTGSFLIRTMILHCDITLGTLTTEIIRNFIIGLKEVAIRKLGGTFLSVIYTFN